MSDNIPTEKTIFLAALELASPAERAEFLGRACGGNRQLLEAVEALLAAHGQEQDLLDVTAATQAERPGTQIGPYKLLQQIGEGGMGVVYLAEQTTPIARRVALKIIKPGMDSRQVIARFEAERQALAMMDHINIARVLDGGTTPAGRPYFVMELVNGLPITKYCDDRQLNPRQRLELFVPVCLAIQHAHQKGIIHRDIKPSNVMITLYDGQPVPKVIDFGVAKATERRLTERTLFTQFGTLVGTPQYMSPEQAEMSALSADTRSDIFSLGVLLYELLTGTTPLSHERIREAAYGEVLRMIKEEEPPRPSTRLCDSGEALASISAQRHMEPARLAKLLRGELDWIVMKTLEKDRNRRYETAGGFAADVLRYLNDEPVQACPPSAAYRLRKFARRNRGPVLVGLSLAALLLLGIASTSIGLMRALKAERTATASATAAAQQRDKAIAAEKRAVAEKLRADEEAAIAQAVNDFLQNDLLAEAAPEENARQSKVTVEELLGRAAARIAGKFDDQPRVEAAIQQTIGDAYHSLGDLPAAQPHLERALELHRRVSGDQHPDTLNSMNNLALLYQGQDQYSKAEPLSVKCLDARRRVLGKEHPDTLNSMNNLAGLHRLQGRLDKAEALYVESLEIRRRVLGTEHPATLRSMNNLAGLYRAQKKFTLAEPLYVQALDVRRRILGEEHPDTLNSMNSLGRIYEDEGQLAQAEPLYQRALAGRRHVLGEEHPQTLTTEGNLAGLYQAQHQYDKAEPLYVQALAGQRRFLGEEHSDTLTTMNNLGGLYVLQNQLAKAEALYVPTLEIRRRVLGEKDRSTLMSIHNLALLYQTQSQFLKAEPLFREYLTTSEALQPDNWGTFYARSLLGNCLAGQRRYAEAEPLLIAGYEGMQQRQSKILASLKLRVTQALDRLVRLYEAWDKPDQAERWRQVLAARKEAEKK